MKKLAYIVGATILLAACNGKEETDKQQPETQHEHQHVTYENEQYSLVSNIGEQMLTFPTLLTPTSENGKQVTYELTAKEGTMTFVDGIETKTYGYNGSFLGPVLRLIKGQEVTIKLTNDLPEPTTFHWHGLEIAGDTTDGSPHAEIAPGETQTITFTVNQEAATLWYHPHPMSNTASQVYKGLAGLMYIEDENSEALQLPNEYGSNDFPLILQDRTFVEGQINYEDVANSMSTLGDTVMINGVVNPLMNVEKGQIRLRILNGSNARGYQLHFDNDLPFKLIATDGGFVNEATEMTELMLNPGERAEIIVDLTTVDSVSLMDDETVLLPIQTAGEESSQSYDSELNHFTISNELKNMEPTKHITLEGVTSKFLLNGKTYDMDRIDFKQKQGETEIWEIENVITDEGAMPHPFHIHGTQFLVVSVDGETPDASLHGYKDTITVQPNQKVRIAVNFSEKGLYMFHCHILEHEDAGMMGQIEVY